MFSRSNILLQIRIAAYIGSANPHEQNRTNSTYGTVDHFDPAVCCEPSHLPREHARKWHQGPFRRRPEAVKRRRIASAELILQIQHMFRHKFCAHTPEQFLIPVTGRCVDPFVFQPDRSQSSNTNKEHTKGRARLSGSLSNLMNIVIDTAINMSISMKCSQNPWLTLLWSLNGRAIGALSRVGECLRKTIPSIKSKML